MNSRRQSTSSLRRGADLPRADGACNIVTFYEDLAAAVRAERAFDSLVEDLGPGRPVRATSWSFTMLAMPEFNAAVVLDAALADVLVVAAKGDQELPPRIATWVEMCINKGEKGRPLLIALHEDGLEPGGAAAPFCSSLEKIASREGADFLCSSDLKERPDDCFATESRQDDVRRLVHIAEGTLRGAAGGHRSWGLDDRSALAVKKTAQ